MHAAKQFGPFLLFAAVAIVAPWLMHASGTEYFLTQLTMALYYAVVVMGLCLVMGYAGQVSMGHGAFFALGGYTTAILTTRDCSALAGTTCGSALKALHLIAPQPDLAGTEIVTATPWAAFATAMLVTFVVAHLIGYPALRLKGHYLAMATLGFGLIVHKLLLGSTLAGSADGITGVPPWDLGFGVIVSGKRSLRVQNYYLACALILLLLLLLRNLVFSRVGRAFQAIHDRETAANAMGIDTSVYKLKAFVTSALLAALAGVFFTHYTGGIGPSEAGALKSVRYLALAAVSGMANLWGAAVVSTIINFCSLRGWFGTLDNAVFGALLILIISIAPEGPLKPLGQALRRLFRARPAAATAGTVGNPAGGGSAPGAPRAAEG